MFNTKLIFNPYYRLLVDEHSPILKNRSGWINEEQNIAEIDFSIRIHPVQATLFSLFDGEKCFNDVIKEALGIFKHFKMS